MATKPIEVILDHQQTEEKMTQLAWDLSAVYHRLAEIFAKMGRHEEAEQYERRSRTQFGNAATHTERHTLLEAQKPRRTR